MLLQSDSQQRYRELEAAVRQLTLPGQAELRGSFSTFYRWLQQEHQDIVLQAQEVALDIRLWRDTQDVLRQVWERIYRR